MRRLLRILLNAATALSLLLFVATVAMSVRSYWIEDAALLPSRNWWHRYSLASYLGTIEIFRETLRPPSDAPRWSSGRLDGAASSELRRELRQETGFLGFGYRTTGVRKQMLIVHVPYWSVGVILALLPAVWTIRRRARKHRNGRCSVCGYDLRATPERCPECGAVPTAQPARPGGAGG
jgi:hypothetical protein